MYSHSLLSLFLLHAITFVCYNIIYVLIITLLFCCIVLQLRKTSSLTTMRSYIVGIAICYSAIGKFKVDSSKIMLETINIHFLYYIY